VTSTRQTWAIVGAALGAALLGVIVGFIGTAYLQGRQAKTDARNRLESALAELLAAAHRAGTHRMGDRRPAPGLVITEASRPRCG
jgi:hypothetical protein